MAVGARHHRSCWTNGSEPLWWSRRLPRSKPEPGRKAPVRDTARPASHPRSDPHEQFSRAQVPSSPRVTQDAVGDSRGSGRGRKPRCLPSAASPARAGSTSARAQIRGRKRAARMEEGPRRRNRTREEPNLQESRGRENRQCQPGSCGCRVSPPARPACDSGHSARARASPQGSAAAPRLRGGYPGPTSHTARAPMRQKLGCRHTQREGLAT